MPRTSTLVLVAGWTFGGLAAFATVCLAADAKQDVMGKWIADLDAVRLAVEDLTRTFPQTYPQGKHYLAQIDAHKQQLLGLERRLAAGEQGARVEAAKLAAVWREALLANPLLDFDRLLLVDHDEKDIAVGGPGRSRGLPMNYEGNSSIEPTGYDNQISVLSPVRPEGKLSTLFRPEGGRFVGDVDLDFDADRLLFSMPGSELLWQVFEIRSDGSGLRQLPLIDQPNVDNYDGCYLPDGNVLFTSSACFAGVPCVAGFHHVANLYRLESGTGQIRQLTFDQDHNWCPTVLEDGRVLYTRWEYADIPHAFSRLLFQMNPDGTGQRAFYGSNSYWPTSIFFARPIPDQPNKVVAVVSGHHGVPRMGELVLFDVAKGRQETDGAVQRIPGFGKRVEPILLDNLADNSWPKFLHPFPLSDKYFIVSAKPTPKSLWGIYLVDVFDNVVLLKEVPGRALLEPIPLRKSKRPPVVASKIDLDRKDASVYLADIYTGPGLTGVPRGTVKKLRILTYHYAYRGMGGQQNRVGLDGPWDIRRVLGTVPVEADGSAAFRVPANTPIALQPLDTEGRAVQLMRSWMTAMPGEVLSCVGCHETQNTVPPTKSTIASRRPPSDIAPWYGPARGFSFRREVQPVLDRYCVGCHNGQPQRGIAIPDLRPQPEIVQVDTKYTPSYWALRRFVRTPTIESDMHLLLPYEYHADTTELVQMLRKGHHNVQLDQESWDRLITWIDINTPAHGTWHELLGRPVTDMSHRRSEMLKRYVTGRDEDPEDVVQNLKPAGPPMVPAPSAESSNAGEVGCPDWPFDAVEANHRQTRVTDWRRVIDLGDGVSLEMVRIPAGEFPMGDRQGYPDERPVARIRVERPFWIGKFEITNEQFCRFEPSHDSGLERGDFIQLNVPMRGYPLNGPRQPVVRVTWKQAMAFCQWLSSRTGHTFALPTEAQWEYACRAGTATPLWHGELSADFSHAANLADSAFKKVDVLHPIGFPALCVPPWRPAVDSIEQSTIFGKWTIPVDDNHRVSAPVGAFRPNPWGLYDMHGNVAEWTRTLYQPYPYRDEDDRNNPMAEGRRAVRGGSWSDRPQRARSAFRQAYWPWQPVFNVGFRVVCEAADHNSKEK